MHLQTACFPEKLCLTSIGVKELESAISSQKLVSLHLNDPLPSRIELDLFTHPTKIDLSGVKIDQFALAFSNAFGYEISYQTNRTHLKDVKWFGCSDFHGGRDPYESNTLLIKLLNYPQHGSVLTEDMGEGLYTHMIDQHALPTTTHYRAWDNQSMIDLDCGDGIENVKKIQENFTDLGKLAQRILYVAKQECRIAFHKKNGKRDSFKAIEKDLIEHIKNKKQILQLDSIKIYSAQRGVSSLNFLRGIDKLIDNIDHHDRILDPKMLISLVEALLAIESLRVGSLAATTFNFRQKHLCRVLDSEKTGGFIVAGQKHLIVSEAVEKCLEKYLESRRAGYLFFYNTMKKSKVSNFSCSSSSSSQASTSASSSSRSPILLLKLSKERIYSILDKSDFDNKKILKTLIFTDFGLLCKYKIETAKWFVSTYYGEKGIKKEGVEAPKKSAGVLANYWAHLQD